MILDDEDILIQDVIDSACYKMVDLGLSVKWANKNVGAYSPEDAGLYFQWGDTVGYTAEQVGKDKVFDWDNYKFGTTPNLTKYNSTDDLKVLEPIDDAATVYMGSQYRMPTCAEIRELINNTTQTFIDLDGNEYIKGADTINIESEKLKGVRFTGSNGNSIFIPAVGYCGGSRLHGTGMEGRLWSSSLSDMFEGNSRRFGFYFDSDVYEIFEGRRYGLPIRGVEKISNKS